MEGPNEQQVSPIFFLRFEFLRTVPWYFLSAIENQVSLILFFSLNNMDVFA